MRIGLIDRAVLVLAPERALPRIRARKQAEVLMNYDGASTGRRTSTLTARGTDADAALRRAAPKLRMRARDQVRNRAYATRGVSVITSHVVGSGVVASVQCQDDAAKLALQSLIKEHLQTTFIDARGALNLAGIQRIAMRTVVVDGEVFLRRRYRSGAYRRDLPLPFQIEMIEADQLDTSATTHKDNRVQDGIEYGPTGAAVAYHFLSEHPGSDAFPRSSRKTTRVPAQDVIHIRRIDRPGQMRGVSWLSPVMLDLQELSDYHEAEGVKQKMASLFAGVVEREMTEEPGASGERENKTIEDLAPGAVVELEPGQKVQWTQNPDVRSLDPMTRISLRRIAGGLGITYESLSGDLSGTNYSSIRAGRIEMDQNVDDWQQELMIAQLGAGVARWFKEAIDLDPRTASVSLPWSMVWTPPARAMIDPTKDIGAWIKEIDAGLNSRRRRIRQMGRDPDTIENERQEDRQADRHLDAAEPPQE